MLFHVTTMLLRDNYTTVTPESSKGSKLAADVYEGLIMVRAALRRVKDWARDQRDRARNQVMDPMA